MIKLVVVLAIAVAAPLLLTAFNKERRGTFLGVPYNFERPTLARIKRSLYDPDDARLLTPHVYGWGYSLNLHALARRLRLV